MLFPAIGGFFNHHMLQPAVWDRSSPTARDRAGCDGAPLRARSEAYWDEIAAIVAATPGIDHLILSSEILYLPMGRLEQARLVARLERLGGPVRVVAYVRAPADAYLSTLQQRLKRYAAYPGLFVRDNLAILDSYAEAFGREALSVRPFDRAQMAGGDVVRDFCAVTDIPADLLTQRPTDAKPSISAEAMAALQRLGPLQRSHDAAHLRRQKVLRAWVAAADRKVAGFTKPRLTEAAQRAVTAAASEFPALKARYGLDFAEAAAAEPAPPLDMARVRRVEEICVVDRARLRNILRQTGTATWRLKRRLRRIVRRL